MMSVQLAAAVEPWFTPWLAGPIFGGGVGVLGGVYGTLVGILAPRGLARGFVMGLHWTYVVIGLALLGTGITALITGQPYGVWFGFLLPGAILSVLMLSFTPMIRLRYRQAEQRRLEAEEFRRA
jgi:hypothetical protein